MLLLPSLPGGFGRPSGQVPNHPLVGEEGAAGGGGRATSCGVLPNCPQVAQMEEFPVATAKDPNNECPTPKERVKTLQVKSREKWPRGPYGGESGVGGTEKAPKKLLKKDNTQHPPKELKVGDEQDAYLAQVGGLAGGSGGCLVFLARLRGPLSAPLSGPATAGLSA